jgi:HAD superfamily hydrolase (TIGR01549 family)
MKDLIVFDMDGVLVDVTASYRTAIQATVLHFSGHEPPPEDIQKLSHAMIRERGKDVPYQTVVDHFQEIFHGGLILRELWVATDGLFDRLAERHHMAVFTGRFRWEAHVTLKRFLPGVFDPVVGVDDVAHSKPDPEGLLKICSSVPHGKCWYVGDTVDDARASAAARVPFIGIASPASPRHDFLVQLLRDEGAVAVLDDINQLEAAIAQNG